MTNTTKKSGFKSLPAKMPVMKKPSKPLHKVRVKAWGTKDVFHIRTNILAP